MIIAFETKWGDDIRTGTEKAIFDEALRERIDEGYWYEDNDEAQAELDAGRSKSFMESRRDYEYEGFRILDLR